MTHVTSIDAYISLCLRLLPPEYLVPRVSAGGDMIDGSGYSIRNGLAMEQLQQRITYISRLDPFSFDRQ